MDFSSRLMPSRPHVISASSDVPRVPQHDIVEFSTDGARSLSLGPPQLNK